jgi:hypothetical protein
MNAQDDPPLEHWPVRGWVQAAALVAGRARREIERLCLRGVDIDYTDRVELLSARIEANCPAIVIIDTDLLAMPDGLTRMARSLRADVLTVALVNHWSEREERLIEAVDIVLHKPPRREEWLRLARLED